MSADVRTWVATHARPVSVIPDGPLLELPASVSRARVVGVASSVRSARELITATHTIVRALVARDGFRAVMIEGTDDVAAALDRHVHTGEGDPAEMLARGQGFVRYGEVLAAVELLREWNREHPADPAAIVHDAGGPLHAVGSLEEVERRLADRDLDWHRTTGHRVVHWGGTAHVLVGDPRTVPPHETHTNAGGWLRRHLGAGYAALALTVGSGNAPFHVPPLPADFAEDAFADVRSESTLLDLATAADGPAAVRAWLRRPLRTRMIGPVPHPDDGHADRVDAGPLGSAVDATLHVARASPATALPVAR